MTERHALPFLFSRYLTKVTNAHRIRRGREASSILTNYIGVKEAAEITGLAVRTVIQLCKEGKAKAVLIGGRYIISEKWALAERDRRAKPEGFVTVTEAMKIAGVSRGRIHELIARGKLKTAARTGPRIWIDGHSLKLWTRERDDYKGGI